jgi:hypothetical protein
MEIATKEDLESYIDQKVKIIFEDDMIAVLNIIKIFLKLKEKLNAEGQADSNRIYNSYAKIKSENASTIKLYDHLESLLINI